MEYRLLGSTDLKVSSITLGTVELGMDYGIKESGGSNCPDREEAIRLLHHAVDSGINMFDTAPAYGISEELIGEAIGHQPGCYIATKISIPACDGKLLTGARLQEEVVGSLEGSLRRLRRDILDIVQIHNATTEVMGHGEVVDILLRSQRYGKIRHIGVSVYGERAALTAIDSGYFDVIQVAYSLLDQRMALHVFPRANRAGVGIMNRSALLKGALTPRARWLPDKLMGLRQASRRITDVFRISWEKLPEMAIRFCLSSGYVNTVLIGVSNKEELDTAIDAAQKGILNDEELKMADGLAVHDEYLLNPSHWPIW